MQSDEPRTDAVAPDGARSSERTRGRGELESLILHALWSSDHPLTAREIQQKFSGNVPAITTVLTVLERLRNKGQVERTSIPGGSITFQATRSESEHAVQAMLASLTETTDREAALLHFAGRLTDRDVDLLRDALAARPKRGRGSRSTAGHPGVD